MVARWLASASAALSEAGRSRSAGTGDVRRRWRMRRVRLRLSRMEQPTLVIGLDCVPPRLFDFPWAASLVNLQALWRGGSAFRARSTVPPITVPAWASMTTGRSPGELGLYGFRDRIAGSYNHRINLAHRCRAPRIWDTLSAQGYRTAAVSVPLTWPVVPREHTQDPLVISGLLTPSRHERWCNDDSVAAALTATCGHFIPDVLAYRNVPLEEVLGQAHALTKQRFAMVRQLLQAQAWDFMMLVDIAPDRVHHAAWRHLDPAHPYFNAHTREHAQAVAYYHALDDEVGRLCASLPATWSVRIVSDHGAKARLGAFYINAYLEQLGLLTWKEEGSPACSEPQQAQKGRPTTDDIDFSRTLAWAEGGYYARVYLNLADRDPEGVIHARDAARTLEEVRAALLGAPLPADLPAPWVVRPEEVYPQAQGNPPDLMACFGDLAITPLAGRAPRNALYEPAAQDDTDSCVHDWDGLLALPAQPPSHPTPQAADLPVRLLTECLTDLVPEKPLEP